MKEADLDGYLDRMEGSRSFENGGVDPNHMGRHFVGTISPYLYASRKFDLFSRTYFNRWRIYNPRWGRFLTKDPIGFNGGSNLWAYAKQNPLRYTDPFGLTVDQLAFELRTAFRGDLACEIEGLYLSKEYELVYQKVKAMVTPLYGWRVERLLYDDSDEIAGVVPSWIGELYPEPFIYANHGDAFGTVGDDPNYDPVQYARMARGFLLRAISERLPARVEPPTGVHPNRLRVYDPTTNSFGVYDKVSGFYKTLTFFKPDPGYWDDKNYLWGDDPWSSGATILPWPR